MDPNANVREQCAILEGLREVGPVAGHAERERLWELQEAYAGWRACGGFAADADLLRRLRAESMVVPVGGPDLSLWLVETDACVSGCLTETGESMVVLGREVCGGEVARLVRDGATVLRCTAIVPGSAAEQGVVWDGNGCDLLSPLIDLAVSAGFDVEPERCDPYALLLTLREWHRIGGLSDEQASEIARAALDAGDEVAKDRLLALGFGHDGDGAESATDAAEAKVWAALKGML